MRFFRKHQKKIVSVLAFLLALLMLVPLLANILTIGAGATGPEDIKSEIASLKGDYNALAQKRQELAAQLKDIRSDKSKAVKQKELVENEIEALRSQIRTSDQLIAQYDSLIAQKEVELSEAIAQEEKQFELFCERVRYMEEEGTVSYWSILFNAADFSDLLDRFNFVSEVMEYDNAVMDALAVTRQQVADTKAELESEKAEQEQIRTEQLAQKSELDEKLLQAEALVSEIAAKEDAAEEADAELKKAADALTSEIASLQKEYDALINEGKITINTGTGYQWPLSGYTTLSSLFGTRTDPFTGKPGNHTGIDIPAPKNTKILAARGGVVTISKMGSGSDWSYGNYVVISHGDGTSTLYAHMNSRAVSVGDVVEQGKCIGYVGTTGRSTGNHLHYEVRVNGVRTDPVNYYPGMTLYYRYNGAVKKLEH